MRALRRIGLVGAALAAFGCNRNLETFDPYSDGVQASSRAH